MWSDSLATRTRLSTSRYECEHLHIPILVLVLVLVLASNLAKYSEDGADRRVQQRMSLHEAAHHAIGEVQQPQTVQMVSREGP